MVNKFRSEGRLIVLLLVFAMAYKTMSGLEEPNHDLTVVSMLHLVEGTQYRPPGLEDGYVWLMKNSNQQVEVD